MEDDSRTKQTFDVQLREVHIVVQPQRNTLSEIYYGFDVSANDGKVFRYRYWLNQKDKNPRELLINAAEKAGVKVTAQMFTIVERLCQKIMADFSPFNHKFSI